MYFHAFPIQVWLKETQLVKRDLWFAIHAFMRSFPIITIITRRRVRTRMVTTLPTASARFVIDTDAGVDDAVAIMLALHAFPREAVLGVTTVFGNVDLHQANHNVAQYDSLSEMPNQIQPLSLC